MALPSINVNLNVFLTAIPESLFRMMKAADMVSQILPRLEDSSAFLEMTKVTLDNNNEIFRMNFPSVIFPLLLSVEEDFAMKAGRPTSLSIRRGALERADAAPFRHSSLAGG